MSHNLKLLKLFTLVLICILSIDSVQGADNTYGGVTGGFGGSISATTIEQNSDVTFGGSVYNIHNVSIFYIYFLNVTFRELLGESSTRTPKRYNYTKTYDSNFRLNTGEIFSDTYRTKVDLNPGKYNVSIAFTISNGTASASSAFRPQYAMGNQSVEVIGVSQSQKVLIAFRNTILAILGIIVLTYLYLKYVKK